jgi:hypothetical protein
MCDWIMNIVMWALFLLVGVAIAFLGAVIYKEFISEKLTLIKAEWTCTQSHKQRITTLIPIGKVLVPSTSVHDVCDRYERKR